MDFLRKFGFFFLLLGVLSDFLTPYVLGLYYPELDQMKSVISVFGEVSSPVRKAFLIWSVVSGIFFILSLPALYAAFASTSRVLATLVTASIGFYGIGDCIFTGLFSINTHESSWNVSTWVHNIGSGLGYSGFLLFPVLLFLIYRKNGQMDASHLYLGLSVISLLFAAIYGLARIPSINSWPLLNKIGFCQRISFFFNYVPIAWLSILHLKQ